MVNHFVIFTTSGFMQSLVGQTRLGLCAARRAAQQGGLLMNRFRFASIAIALALATSFGWVAPAAAIDLTAYSPFQAGVHCTGSPCQTTYHTPINKITVLEFVSFECPDMPFGSRLFLVFVNTTINGVGGLHNLEIPVAATLGVAPNGTAQNGQVVRLYADPNSDIKVFAEVTPSASINCAFGFSGEQSPALPP
jgi:hypothetical protein